ncbi:5'/3'-nucleotidase SurE [Desulfonatronovibrio hydrogenovorans]|uniref:5'/3'-nucleotidase SurE n=1 Tax=Desulfonatronovibrio hydrogenovorans TaxID=53245 RepID=UPI00048D9ED3|nr:5'/3'-nucleotidase SurE [Desulfonatronovibrio hydrogenovorans]
MEILLTNDDGIHAPGIKSLYQALITAGHRVRVVAPLTEQSAVGHSVTIFSPIRVREIQEQGLTGHALSGTPVDCVKWAMNFLLGTRPDLVVSGINNGANVGIDVLYSGTVSAATEGALAGVPALAVSIDDFNPQDLRGQAQWTAGLIERFPWDRLPEQNVLNLNFPACSMDRIQGVRVCSQTNVVYQDRYHCRKDPRGGDYYWLGGEIPMQLVDPEADRALLSRNYVTLTPLKFELTNFNVLNELQEIVQSAKMQDK